MHIKVYQSMGQKVSTWYFANTKIKYVSVSPSLFTCLLLSLHLLLMHALCESQQTTNISTNNALQVSRKTRGTNNYFSYEVIYICYFITSKSCVNWFTLFLLFCQPLLICTYCDYSTWKLLSGAISPGIKTWRYCYVTCE